MPRWSIGPGGRTSMRFVSDTKDSRWPGQSYSEFLSHWKQLYVKPLVVVRNLQTGCMSVHGARGEGDREKMNKNRAE